MTFRTNLDYLVPEDGDTPAEVLAAVQEAILRLARHTHSGDDAEPLTVTNTVNEEQVASATTTPALTWSAARDDEGLFTADLPVLADVSTRERTITIFENLANNVRVRTYLEFRVTEGEGTSNNSVVIKSNRQIPSITVKYA